MAVVVREDSKCFLNKNPQCNATNMLMSYVTPIGSTTKALVCRLQIIVCKHKYLDGTGILVVVTTVLIHRVGYRGDTLNAMHLQLFIILAAVVHDVLICRLVLFIDLVLNELGLDCSGMDAVAMQNLAYLRSE